MNQYILLKLYHKIQRISVFFLNFMFDLLHNFVFYLQSFEICVFDVTCSLEDNFDNHHS